MTRVQSRNSFDPHTRRAASNLILDMMIGSNTKWYKPQVELNFQKSGLQGEDTKELIQTRIVTLNFNRLNLSWILNGSFCVFSIL